VKYDELEDLMNLYHKKLDDFKVNWFRLSKLETKYYGYKNAVELQLAAYNNGKLTLNNEVILTVLHSNLIFSLKLLKKHANFRFKILSCISGVDLLDQNYRFSVVYDLLSLTFNSRLRIKVFINEATAALSIIYVYINSPGGSVDAGNLFINNLKYQQKMNKSIECIAQSAYSMAFHILQHCDRRYITETSKVMQHQISIGNIEGPLVNTMNYLQMVANISYNMNLYSAMRLKITLDEYLLKVNNDWWLYGQDIINNNSADEIIYIGCNEELYSQSYIKEKVELDIDKNGNFGFIKKKVTFSLCPI
jgi:ATP-dependent protease ClpP protease subunit